MNKMIAASLMYNGKIFKAANKQKELPTYPFEYDIKSKGFKDLQ